MREFDFVEPASVAEACALLDEAAMMMRHMTARGVITGLDGDSLLPNLRESSARLCKTDTAT